MTQPNQSFYINGDQSYDSRYRAGDKPTSAGGRLIAYADFSNGSITPSTLPDFPTRSWLTGTTGGVVASVSDGMLRADYPITGGAQIYCVCSLNGLTEVWVDFYAKFINPHAVKFLKFHGVDGGGGNYANATFGLSGGGEATQVSFGDGSTISNDTANVIFLDGSNPSWIGRSYPTATVLTPQNAKFDGYGDGNLHHIRAHYKRNSGTTSENEVADGAFYLEIDGLVYVDATNVFNRHYSNGPLDRVVFGDIAQDSDYAFSVFYDTIKISDEGWPA